MAMRTRLHLGLITLCLFAGNERAVAQFDALPDSNATWTTSFWIGPGYPYQGFHHTYDPLHPDTVINGVTYQRLLESGYYAGALLDNGLGQVYHVQPGTTEPVLLYDFDVVVGDTVYGVFGLFEQDAVVVSVETIVVNDTPLLRVGVECSGMPSGVVHWTQWIGGDGGLLTTTVCSSVSGTGALICMSVNDIGYFGIVGEPVDCSFYMGTPESVEQAVTPFPNPADEVLYIPNLVPGRNVELILGDGRTLRRLVMANGQVDVSDLLPGIHLMRIAAEGDAPLGVRFVKR